MRGAGKLRLPPVRALQRLRAVIIAPAEAALLGNPDGLARRSTSSALPLSPTDGGRVHPALQPLGHLRLRRRTDPVPTSRSGRKERRVERGLMATDRRKLVAVVRRQSTANAAPTAKLAANRARRPSFAVTIARGSSDHAALYLKHLVELKTALACASLGPSLASLYHAPLRLADAVAIAISQSGRSPDIVAMQRAARDRGP